MLLIESFRLYLPAALSGSRQQDDCACFGCLLPYPQFKTLQQYENRNPIPLKHDPAANLARGRFPSFLLELEEEKLPETSLEPIPLLRTIQMVNNVGHLMGFFFENVSGDYSDNLFCDIKSSFSARSLKLRMVSKCVGGFVQGCSRVHPSVDSYDKAKKYEPLCPVEIRNGIARCASLFHHRSHMTTRYVVKVLKNLRSFNKKQ